MDLTRKQIKEILPNNVTFSLRKISFSDLARDEAYKLTVKQGGKELPNMFTPETLKHWQDVIDAVKEVKKHTYKGGKII
ncbi:MAG: hypothetical protein ACOCP8_02705 [archaeon]